jgi:O-antigen/teichoic acid export membrane protein
MKTETLDPPATAAPDSYHAGTSRGTRIARNLVASLGGQIVSWAATSVIIVVVPRYLGEDGLGKFTFAMGFPSLFGIFVIFGLSTYLPREIARDPSSAGHLAVNAMVSRIPPILLSAVAITVFVNLLDYPAATKNLVYLTTWAMALSTAGATIDAALQGLERMTYISVISVIEKLLVAGLGVFVLIVLDMGVLAFTLVNVVAVLISVLLKMAFLTRVAHVDFRMDPLLWRRLYTSGVPFFIWSAALVIYNGIDITMLSIMTRDDVVGWYGLAYRFVGIPAFVPFAVTAALLPTLSASHGEEFRRLARRCLDLVVLTTFPIAAAFVVCAAAIIHLFNYDAGFDHSIILLRILALFGPFASIGMVIGTVLIAQDREKPWAKVAIAAALLNPALNLGLIPLFESSQGNGAIGAAVATVITEAAVFGAAVALVGRSVFGWDNVLLTARCLAACAAMSAVMLLLLPFGLFPALIVGGCVYVGAAFALKAVRISEIRDVQRLMFARRQVTEMEPVA